MRPRHLLTAVAALVAAGGAAVPAHAATNGRIYYANDQTSTAWSVDPAGGPDRNEAPPGVWYGIYDLAISPDGTRVAWASTNVYVADIDGTDVRQVSSGTNVLADMHPAWNATGTRLAFARDYDDDFAYATDLHTVNIAPDNAPSGQTRITDVHRAGSSTFNAQDHPSWSPNGAEIAFHADGPATSGDEIRALSSSGGTPRVVLSGDAGATQPAWGPGNRIAFVRYGPSGSQDIAVVDASGSHPSELVVDDIATDEHPTWSPDGTRIAFQSFGRRGQADWEIFTVNPANGAVARVTDDTTNDLSPTWTQNVMPGPGACVSDNGPGDLNSATGTITTGAGDDVVCGGTAAETINAGAGDDRVLGGGGHDRINGQDGDDTLLGDAGDDTIDGGGQADYISGGPGSDAASYATRRAAVAVSIGGGGPDGDGALDASLTIGGLYDDVRGDIEKVAGGASYDWLYGDEDANTLTGGGGSDYLAGWFGNDTLAAGAGDDQLAGEDGDDQLGDPSSGGDYVSGGEGVDSVSYASKSATQPTTVTMHDSLWNDGNPTVDAHAAGADTYDNIAADVENLTGGQGNDDITGNALANKLVSGAGNDVIRGREGVDTFDSGAGLDVIRSAGDGEPDSVKCGEGPGTADDSTNGGDQAFADPVDRGPTTALLAPSLTDCEVVSATR